MRVPFDDDLEKFIADVEQKSLTALCSRLNCEIDEYVQDMIGLINRVMSRSIASFQRASRPSAHPARYEGLIDLPLRNREDLLAFNRQGASLERNSAVDTIVKRLACDPSVVVEYDYLNTLAHKLLPREAGKKPDMRNPTDLGKMLRIIPFVSTYDDQFNSMITFGETDRRIPIIHHYQYLSAIVLACSWWLSLYGVRVSPTGDNLVILPAAIRNEPARLNDIVQTLIDLVRPFPVREVKYPPFSIQDEATTFAGTLLFSGASEYIWLHEFAHILLAHERSEEEMIKQETDADSLALDLLLTAEDSNAPLRLTGVDIPLWVLMVRQTIRGTGSLGQPTHPPTDSRLIQAAEFFEQRLTGERQNMYRSFFKLCEPLHLAFKYIRRPELRPSVAEITRQIEEGPYASKGLPIRFYADLIPTESHAAEPYFTSYVCLIGDESGELPRDILEKCWSWLRHRIVLLDRHRDLTLRGAVVLGLANRVVVLMFPDGTRALHFRWTRMVHKKLVQLMGKDVQGCIGGGIEYRTIRTRRELDELIGKHVELSSFAGRLKLSS